MIYRGVPDAGAHSDGSAGAADVGEKPGTVAEPQYLVWGESRGGGCTIAPFECLGFNVCLTAPRTTHS